MLIRRSILKGGLGAFVFVCALTTGRPAQASQALLVQPQLSDTVAKAASVLHDMATAVDRDNRIPHALMERAEAIAVIPSLERGTRNVENGNSYGKGLVSERLADGRWTAPVFIKIWGGSWEPPRDVSPMDVILVFTNADALRTLEEGTNLKLGADASMDAGPIGPSFEAPTDAKLEVAIHAYSRAKGLFTGAALDGAVLTLDNESIHKAYGQDVTARGVFLSETILANSTVKPFLEALQQATAKLKVTER